MKKIGVLILLVFLVLVLIRVGYAQVEKYYELMVFYEEGNFTLKKISVKPITEEIKLDQKGSYTYFILDREGMLLYSGNFSLKNTFLVTPEVAGEEALDPFEASSHKLSKFNLNLYLPYFPADKIQLKKGEELLLEVGVSRYNVNRRSNIKELPGEEVKEEVLVKEEVNLTKREIKEETKDVLMVVGLVLGVLFLLILVLVIIKKVQKKKVGGKL